MRAKNAAKTLVKSTPGGVHTQGEEGVTRGKVVHFLSDDQPQETTWQVFKNNLNSLSERGPIIT